jgi:hypothetical protein
MAHTPRGAPIAIPPHGLPGETEGRAAVQSRHAADLGLMERTLRLALGLISGGGATVTRPRGSSPGAFSVVIGLYAKACKTHRSVQLLCEAGLAEDAHSATRTLLELMIAIGWILQKATRSRAQMYLAHLSKRDEKILKAMKRTKGLKRYAKKGLFKMVADQIAASERILGAAQVAKLADSYSGMNLRDTARAIHQEVTYELYYRHASKYQHGSDLASHAGVPEDGGAGIVLSLSPGPSEELGRAALMASVFLFAIAQVIDKKFGLGHEAQLQEFGERELRLKPTKKAGQSKP